MEDLAISSLPLFRDPVFSHERLNPRTCGQLGRNRYTGPQERGVSLGSDWKEAVLQELGVMTWPYRQAPV